MLNKNNLLVTAKESINRFIKYNHSFSLFLIALAFLKLAFVIDTLVEKDIRKDGYVEKISSYVTYISDSGVTKQYEQEVFDVDNEEKNVQNYLSKYLIQSTYNLTDNYTKAYFPSADALFKATLDFRDFYKNFIAINKENATKKQLEGYASAIKDWEQIMTYFMLAINENRLVHIVDKKESKIVPLGWDTKGQNFKIAFKIPIFASSRNKNKVIDEGTVYAQINAEGYFNLREMNVANPRGLKFTSFKLQHPEIDHSKK